MLPSRLLRRLSTAVLAAVLAPALAIQIRTCRAPAPDCRTASIRAPPIVAAAVCERAYLRRPDPEIGVRLADAHRRAGNLAIAGAIANGLLVTSARADAWWILGRIAAAEHRFEAARRAFETAAELRRTEPREPDAAEDDLARPDAP